jgi:hypothetical protein
LNKSIGKSPFQIMYGMNPRGFSELRYLNQSKFRSAGAKDFTAEMQELHNQIKEQVKKNNDKYKHRADQHKRKLNLKLGINF